MSRKYYTYDGVKYIRLYPGSEAGVPIEINTPEEMSALLLDEINEGKIFKYIGAPTSEYETNALYMVQDL